MRAIAEGDIALVATVPGIGRKTAERVILELRDKVGALEPPGTQHPAATERERGRRRLPSPGSSASGSASPKHAARLRPSPATAMGSDVADLVGAALRRLDTAGACAMSDERMVSPEELEAERVADTALRPRTLDDFVGQAAIKNQVAHPRRGCPPAWRRTRPRAALRPAGLGKTTLAQIIAAEMGVNVRLTSGPALEHQGMLASILTSLEERDVFFIDEVHRLNRAVEEALYPAMEDLAFDFVAGKGAGAQTLRLTLNRFTVIGATTRAGALGAPLRDRFGVTFRLDFYDTDDLVAIANRSARLLGIELEPEGAAMIARAIPRHAADRQPAAPARPRLRPGARRRAASTSTWRRPRSTCSASTSIGLDELDRRVLNVLCGTLGGHAVGVQTIAVSVQEDPDTIEDVVEPFLIRRGLLARDAARPACHRRRLPAPRAARHPPAHPARQRRRPRSSSVEVRRLRLSAPRGADRAGAPRRAGRIAPAAPDP